jgi:superfamily II DNA or RNA helicase
MISDLLRPHQIECCDAQNEHDKGIICGATGMGKTLVGIACTAKQFESETPQTVVVVAPRILLANQLSSEYLEHITNVAVLHVHSGETHHNSTTKPWEIQMWDSIVRTACNPDAPKHKLIFTTYHSLHKVMESGIKVNTIHFDEAHNSVQKNFYPAVEYFSQHADRCYYYTATPKYSSTPKKPGMNNVRVYGNIIANISAPRMVNEGYIIPPRIVTKQVSLDSTNVFERDCNHLLESIDEAAVSKILVCAKATKQIISLISQTDFCLQLEERGYSWMVITSKTGAIIDGKKVNREEFFETLHEWSKDDSKKFVLLHYSILSEGINVSGLEAVIFMRSMDVISICQTIGRVVRLHHKDSKGLRNGSIEPGNLSQYHKSYGLVVIPTFNSVGISTAKKIQNVVDTVFQQGEPAISTIKK